MIGIFEVFFPFDDGIKLAGHSPHGWLSAGLDHSGILYDIVPL